MKKLLFILTVSLFLPQAIFAQTKTVPQTIFAKKYDYVNDFEKILTSKQIQSLSEALKSYEAKTKHKIMIVTTASITPYTDFNSYSIDLDKYLHSTLKMDTSILLVVSKQLRQIQFRGADRLRSRLSDKEIENVISTYVIPELKKGDYYKGLQEGTAQIAKKIE